MTLKEGMGMLGEEMTTEIEWVRDPEARHTTMYGASGEVMMEIIIIGDDSWTSMDGENWMHVKQTEQEEEAPFSAEDFQTSLEDIMRDMESGMKKDGKEKVNDVNCIRYTVDADFSMPFPAPEEVPEGAAQFMPKEIEGHVEGMIWVADEKSLPPVIIHLSAIRRDSKNKKGHCLKQWPFLMLTRHKSREPRVPQTLGSLHEKEEKKELTYHTASSNILLDAKATISLRFERRFVCLHRKREDGADEWVVITQNR